MIKSMTAFGSGKAEYADKDITVEIKSVNSRYFDASVRAPRNYLPLEERIKGYVQKNCTTRGKVDIYVTVVSHSAESVRVDIDTELAKGYINALCRLRDMFCLKDDITVMSVAQNKDLFTYAKADCDIEEEWNKLLPALEKASEGYCSMRVSEGGKTEADISEKMEIFAGYAKEVAEISKNEIVGYRDRFESRVRALLSDSSVVIDENRILTECSIYADKVAIDEELARLDSHREAFYGIIASNEPAGRKLDFLLQEFNRETNTIASKANNVKIASLAVNMKSELEKIREQIQNIE